METVNFEQQARNAIKWIDGLLKTRLKQGEGQLGNKEDGYCCLGYGCVKLEIPFIFDEGTSEIFQENVGLFADNGNIRNTFFFIDDLEYGSLVDLNDDAKLTFNQIAKEIKNNLDGLFVPKVASILKKHYES